MFCGLAAKHWGRLRAWPNEQCRQGLKVANVVQSAPTLRASFSFPLRELNESGRRDEPHLRRAQKCTLRGVERPVFEDAHSRLSVDCPDHIDRISGVMSCAPG